MTFQHSIQGFFHDLVTKRDLSSAVTAHVKLSQTSRGQAFIANMLWHTSILILTSSVFVLTTAAIKFPGRKESIRGKTYFGSEQLLKTEIDDVKPFIAELTLPETGLEVTGSAQRYMNSLSVTTKRMSLTMNWSLTGSYQLWYILMLQCIAYLI